MILHCIEDETTVFYNVRFLGTGKKVISGEALALDIIESEIRRTAQDAAGDTRQSNKIQERNRIQSDLIEEARQLADQSELASHSAEHIQKITSQVQEAIVSLQQTLVQLAPDQVDRRIETTIHLVEALQRMGRRDEAHALREQGVADGWFPSAQRQGAAGGAAQYRPVQSLKTRIEDITLMELKIRWSNMALLAASFKRLFKTFFGKPKLEFRETLHRRMTRGNYDLSSSEVEERKAEITQFFTGLITHEVIHSGERPANPALAVIENIRTLDDLIYEAINKIGVQEEVPNIKAKFFVYVNECSHLNNIHIYSAS